MCEKCKQRDEIRAGGAAPEEFVKQATARLKAWADDAVKTDDGLTGVSPERLAQENAVFKEVNGITLEEAWALYRRMHEAAGKGGGVSFSPVETRGVARWITVLARSRSEMMHKIEEMGEIIAMAAMLEQLREAGEKKAGELPMVDLGYGLAGSGKGKKGPSEGN